MEQYNVIALATGTTPPYEDCQAIPESASFAATRKRVFGPASKEKCEKWITENCGQVPVLPAQPPPILVQPRIYLPSADTTQEIESNKGKIIALGIYLLIMIFVSVYPLAGLMMAETDKTKIDAKLGRTPTPTPIPTPTAALTPTATPIPSPTIAPTVGGPTSGNSTATGGNTNSTVAPTKTPIATPTPTDDQNLVKADIPAEVYVYIPLILSGPLSADGYVLLVVIFSGMLGAAIRAIYSFVGHLGFKNFSFNWAWFYVSLPFTGAALSLVIYFVMRGGFYGGPLGKGLVLNLFSFAALAALIGLFTDHAMEKLKQVATTLLSEVSPKVRNAKDIVEKKEAEKSK